MSYIRYLSNPEALYIWAQSDGYVYICHNLLPPLASKRTKEWGEQMKVPCHVFDEVCRRWADGRFYSKGEGIRRRGLEVCESQPSQQTIRASLRKMIKKKEKEDPRDWKIRLSYKGRFFYMWRVTWEYIVKDVGRRDKFEKMRIVRIR